MKLLMRRSVLVAVAFIAGLGELYELRAQETDAPVEVAADGVKQLAPKHQAWTAEEAMHALALNPRDPYLQYVAQQLANRQGNAPEAAQDIERLIFRNDPRRQRVGRVNLFSIFTGALAVHESLQLDTLRQPPQEHEPHEQIVLSKLQGPTIKSHPWKTMLAGRTPKVSALARMVPADQYFVQCRSLTKLIELSEFGGLWAMHLFNQATQDATSSATGQRLKKQLAVRSSPLTRPFYDLVVDQVAVTGSDLYLREGSDVTLLFQLKQPVAFKLRMDAFLAETQKAHTDAVRSEGEYDGVNYVHVATPDRQVHVFSAYPRPDLHVRSNSIVALRRTLAAIRGKTADGDVVERLGETDEFRYIRTLMPEGAPEEDVFIYLSDPFIRHLVGPKLKLTERRRMLVYNHLRMIGHASLMFRTEFGRLPDSRAELVDRRCAPDLFGRDLRQNPFDGIYSLSPNKKSAWCSVVGPPHQMVPCCDIPLVTVSEEEAEQYQAFLEEYNRYWRTFFDPIAIRVQLSPRRYRAETIVLPLIDNSIYTSLASAVAARPKPLDDLPVPGRNIFSVVLNLNKKQLLEQLGDFGFDISREATRRLGTPQHIDPPDVERLVNKGLGSQVGLHVYDSQPLFDFNLSGWLGQSIGSFGGRGLNDDMFWISVLVAALNSPVYVSVPVEDTAVVDEFLDQLDPLMVLLSRQREGGGFIELSNDFYRLETKESTDRVRAFTLQVGPLKWRFFWSRIGDGFYIASKAFILDDLAAAHAERAQQVAAGAPVANDNPTGHAMVRIRPRHWNQVLAHYQLGWTERNRLACLKNLGALSNVARALLAERPETAEDDANKLSDRILQEANRLYGVRFLSPDGGRYLLNPDGKTMRHTIYGSQAAPKQPRRLNRDGTASRVLEGFAGATAELTFLEDGLHAVLTVEKK